MAEKLFSLESHNTKLEEQLKELPNKNKEERDKRKPLMVRQRSLMHNISDLEAMKVCIVVNKIDHGDNVVYII